MARPQRDSIFTRPRSRRLSLVPGVLAAAESQVRTGLAAGGKWIRTIGPPPEIVVDPSGSRRDHRAKYGCLSARPRVRCLCPPGKTQHLLPKSVFDRPGSDRWNLASTTFPDAGPMVRIRFPPPGSHEQIEPSGELTTGRKQTYSDRRGTDGSNPIPSATYPFACVHDRSQFGSFPGPSILTRSPPFTTIRLMRMGKRMGC